MKTTSALRFVLALLAAGASVPPPLNRRPAIRQSAAAARRASRDRQRRAAPAAGRRRHRTFNRHGARQARLYGDRRHACLLRPVRRAQRGGVLHRLCGEGRRRRTGRSLSFSTAGPARRRLSCISAWSARASSISARTAAMPRAPSCATIPIPGCAFTDLVLIDPIGTGWSRTVKPDDAKHFLSVRSDADAMAKFVALYVDKNNRAASPKYLFGESYGGFRAAKTARALQRDQGIAISGIVMLSPLLGGLAHFRRRRRRAALGACSLPSLAAAELERKKAFSSESARRRGTIRHDRLPHHAGRRRRRRATRHAPSTSG